MEMFESKLEDLINRKSFKELDSKERVYVLNHLTENAYNDYHFTLNKIVEAFNNNEQVLVPNTEIPEMLKEHFNTKFQSVKTPFLISIWQAPTLYKYAGVLAVLIIGFFMVNKSGEGIDLQKPKVAISGLVPSAGVEPITTNTSVEVKRNRLKVQQLPMVHAQMKFKKAVTQAIINSEKDTVIANLHGFYIYEPILCLDIDINEQFLGLNVQKLEN